jgi:hypothetical protein
MVYKANYCFSFAPTDYSAYYIFRDREDINV